MAWAFLWLAWFASVFTHHKALRARRMLDRIAAMVGKLIFIHAAARTTLSYTTRRRCNLVLPGRTVARKGKMRRLVGARLRKAMRGNNAAARLFAILAVMRDAETHIARLAKRLHRGVPLVRALYIIVQQAPIPARPAPAFTAADTS